MCGGLSHLRVRRPSFVGEGGGGDGGGGGGDAPCRPLSPCRPDASTAPSDNRRSPPFASRFPLAGSQVRARAKV